MVWSTILDYRTTQDYAGLWGGPCMGRRPKPLNPDDPLQAFAIELRALRDAAGASGEREATCEASGIKRSTYYAWLNGTQLPSSDALEVTVKLWGGDVKHWSELRRQAESVLATPDNAPGNTREIKRTQALICSVEWVNAPVLPFPTTSILRQILDAALQGSTLQESSIHRRDGNGESVLIFDLHGPTMHSLRIPHPGAQKMQILLEKLDQQMVDFCAGKNFKSPFPQLRLFAHEGTLTFDGVDYDGPAMETMANIRQGVTIQDALAGDFAGVIAIASSSAYHKETLAPPPESPFKGWVSASIIDEKDELRVSFRVPK
ncbi:hypothetical protein SSPO_041000 [Streptomyces antimycoticus]|uniref:HTH cro/C1-type domain-containing protein n=1 Tax=Streptomyces antimycoticus TaxID=68175 RepID=A0A499UKN8_9ACTN|nr:helix-turn-helix transcriptional regulator [Streptomyces antimycoticus]BBJ41382.1 hypothetical protein SSPO_041000 [Streptomyces antimycoticus]